MDNVLKVVIGLLLLAIGYMVGIRQNLSLIHSYHCMRVTEEDMPAFCKGLGLGNALVGVGLLLFPLINWLIGQTVAFWVFAVLTLIGILIAIVTIIRFNKGLF